MASIIFVSVVVATVIAHGNPTVPQTNQNHCSKCHANKQSIHYCSKCHTQKQLKEADWYRHYVPRRYLIHAGLEWISLIISITGVMVIILGMLKASLRLTAGKIIWIIGFIIGTTGTGLIFSDELCDAARMGDWSMIVISIISIIVPGVIACGMLTALKNNNKKAKAATDLLGPSLILGLEILIAAEVISTIVIPSWNKLGILAGIVAIRMALGFYLEYRRK